MMKQSGELFSSVHFENDKNATTSDPVTLPPLDTDEGTGPGFHPAIATLHGLLGHNDEGTAICPNFIAIYQSTRYSLGDLSKD